MMPRNSIWLAAAGLALMLGGCTPDGPIKAADKCFPAPAVKWMARAATPDAKAPPSGAAAVSKATIYVDRSGSMGGYLAGATNAEAPLQDMISTLPSVLGLQNIKTDFRTFGTNISAVRPAGGQARDLFACLPTDPGACDNKESRLDLVLAAANGNRNQLSVIISDLWFAKTDKEATGIAELQPALIDILMSDRVVAVYGIDAPFSGKIYDLPQAGTGTFSVPYSGRHPLYMMVIGPKSAVVSFGDSLKVASGSRSLAEGLANGKIRRTLFATDPGPELYPKAEPLSASKHPRVTPDYSPLPPGRSLQRFKMTMGVPTPPGGKSPPQPPEWIGPDPAYFLADAVWQGPTTGQSRVWMRGSDACTWLDRGVVKGGWSGDGSAQQRFSLDPDQLRSAFALEGTYLLVGESRRTSLTQPNAASAWMRSEWNLTPGDAPTVARAAPPLFPTLNLSEFGRMMEGALAIAAQRKNDPIVGFAVMVTVED